MWDEKQVAVDLWLVKICLLRNWNGTRLVYTLGCIYWTEYILLYSMSILHTVLNYCFYLWNFWFFILINVTQAFSKCSPSLESSSGSLTSKACVICFFFSWHLNNFFCAQIHVLICMPVLGVYFRSSNFKLILQHFHLLMIYIHCEVSLP